MGKPRFKPAHLYANPRHFARAAKPELASPNPLDPTQTAWAIYQHQAAKAVLEELDATGHTIEQFATGLQENPAWLKRKLFGQTPADIGDIMQWALALGIHIIPVFDHSHELTADRSLTPVD